MSYHGFQSELFPEVAVLFSLRLPEIIVVLQELSGCADTSYSEMNCRTQKSTGEVSTGSLSSST
jgi:hypothetical protein